MTESFSPDDLPADKPSRYGEVAKMLAAVIGGEPNHTARYATCVSLLTQAFGARFFWTGFYIVDANKPNELIVGPYQGTLGCLRIPFGRGVCGAAAVTGVTQLVEDVHAFPGHIACDSRSNSEIVVPVFGRDGSLAAVLDVDSTQFSAFDHEDQVGLEAICGVLLTTP
jgi:L-methionine (R)-S-oxide reductase